MKLIRLFRPHESKVAMISDIVAPLRKPRVSSLYPVQPRWYQFCQGYAIRTTTTNAHVSEAMGRQLGIGHVPDTPYTALKAPVS